MAPKTFEGVLEVAAAWMAQREISLAIAKAFMERGATKEDFEALREAIKQRLKTTTSDGPLEAEILLVDTALSAVDEFFDTVTLTGGGLNLR